MRERGAVAWRVMLAVVVAVGGVWAAAQLSTQAPNTEAARNATRPVAPAPVAQGGATAGTTVQTQAAVPAASSDPFAGVDVSGDSVLRQIVGIEEKGRAKSAAAKRPATPPVDAATPPRTVEARARDDAAAEKKSARPAVIIAPPPSLAAPSAPAEAARPTSGSVPAPPVSTAPPASVESRPSTAPPGAPATAPANATPPALTDRALAAARVDRAPPPAPLAPPLRIVSRTVPEFPREAIRAGVQSGRVVARLTIDADGRVTATELLNATPPGVFERESRRALSTWRYEAPGRPATIEVELVFTRE